MAGTRVFISFDYDNDARQKDLLVGQSRSEDSPFVIVDWSIKQSEANWKVKARQRIRASEVVCVLCGHDTDTANGVAVELSIAQDEEKPYFLLAAYSDRCVKPVTAKATDKLYKWTWDNLKTLIAGGR